MSGFTLLPVARVGNASVYRGIDISIKSLLSFAPIKMYGNVVINGNIWHAGIDCFTCASLTLNGEADRSKIGVPNGTLSVKSAKHSMLLGLDLKTTGAISDTWGRGGNITNTGVLGSGNDIQIDPKSRVAFERRAKGAEFAPMRRR